MSWISSMEEAWLFMQNMGALNMGLTEEELKPIVDSWRQSNPNIVKLWWDIHKCVIKMVGDKQVQEYKCLKFTYEKGILFIHVVRQIRCTSSMQIRCT